MSRIIIVSGSPTANSRLNGLIEYVEGIWKAEGLAVSHIRVADLPAEALIRADFRNPEIIAAAEQVAAADAVVLASPVYKASYTGVLKTFLDLLPQTGLKDKIALPLFIGGTLAHLLAIDYSLNPLIHALGGRHVLGGVYAIDPWVERLEGGGYGLADELRQRLETAAVQLRDELAWRERRLNG